jgi:hypothetical protein
VKQWHFRNCKRTPAIFFESVCIKLKKINLIVVLEKYTMLYTLIGGLLGGIFGVLLNAYFSTYGDRRSHHRYSSITDGLVSSMFIIITVSMGLGAGFGYGVSQLAAGTHLFQRFWSYWVYAV